MGVRVWCFSFGLCCLFFLSDQCSRKYPFEHYLAVRTPYRFVSNSSLHKVNYEGNYIVRMHRHACKIGTRDKGSFSCL